MHTVTLLQAGKKTSPERTPQTHNALQNVFLLCGIFSSLLYVAMNVIVAMRYEGYSSFSQTVSELSAVEAPTRSLWVILGIVYTALVAVFGWGVYKSVPGNRPLRVAGILLLADGVIGFFWPPMHQREVLAAGGGTLTDTMHIVFSIVTVLLMMLAIGFGAAAFGRRFRVYSIATLILLFVCGALTAIRSPQLEANLPTPWMGVWERISIGVFLLWVIVLAFVLLRRRRRVSDQI
jgi:Protein of unknown function (DUF998)